MAGHPLSAYAIYMGWSYGLPVTVVNAAPVTANYLYVGRFGCPCRPGQRDQQHNDHRGNLDINASAASGPIDRPDVLRQHVRRPGHQ